ncbi:RTA2 [Auxenochlorella protothecoides x Auxenochlorella symbiontica]
MATAAVVDTTPSTFPPTLQNVLDQTSLKWVFVGGKGGVGKTTTACSLAVQLAAVRESVLIISTDPAHNLSDAFRQKFASVPSLVQGFTNLSAMEVDPNPGTNELSELAGPGSFLADISSSIPGIDEAMSFAEVIKQVNSLDYSCIVFDTAPTGHTLRLLQFPTTLEKGLGKLMSLKESFGGMLSQVTALLGAGGEGDIIEQASQKLVALKGVVEEVNRQFKDPAMTTFVCVCIPEFLSLYETERLIQELARFSIDSRNVVINQIIFPDGVGTSRLMEARVRMQQKYLDQYFELYDDFHIVQLPLLNEEVRGTEGIRAFSKHLLQPYSVAEPGREELEAELAVTKARVEQLQQRLQMLSSTNP